MRRFLIVAVVGSMVGILLLVAASAGHQVAAQEPTQVGTTGTAGERSSSGAFDIEIRRNADRIGEIADRVVGQLKDAVARGHDVQLHMHTAWLPEAGASLNQSASIFW